MSSFVFMKVLESAPERYDRGLQLLSRGRIDRVYATVADRVAGPGHRVLDIGCGTGGVALACAARGAEVVAIDRDAGMLAVAREKAATFTGDGNAPARITFLQISAIEIEDHVAKKSLDAVVSCLTFSELSPAEQSYTLATAHSRLKPGGRLVIADEIQPPPGLGRLWHRLKRLPLVVLTYILTQTTTRPVEDLAGQVRAAGFTRLEVTSLWSGSFQIISAQKGG